MSVAASSTDLAPASTEAWLARHPRRVTAALVGAAVFVRLLLVLQIAGGPLPRVHAIVTESDNHFFDEWGRHVAAGDLLQRAPLHPTYGWMRAVAADALAIDPQLPVRLGLGPAEGYDRAAMEEKLWDHWMGGTTFYQEPAYPYLVGLTYRLAGADVWHVFAWQLALGVAGVLLVHRLTRRLFSEAAAAAAGVLAVLAPIPLIYEVTLLRDGLVAYTTLALALVMHWAPGGRRGRWLTLGVAFGAAALLKQTFLVFPVVMGLWRIATVRAPWRDRLPALALAAAGMALGLLPGVLRNLAVGAPALAMNGSAASQLAIFHLASSSPFDLMLLPEYPRVLLAADGRFLTSLIEAAKTHASAAGILVLNLKKLLYAWHGYEAPNNVDYYLFRQAAPLLATLPVTFVFVAPLAGIGLAGGRRARDAWPLIVAVVASIPTLILGIVLSRYRAPITIALVPLAGAGVARLAGWMADRRWRPIAVAASAAAAYLAWATGSPPGKEPALRADTYAFTGTDALARGEPAYAALYLQESLRLRPGVPKLEARLGQALLASGDPEGALRHIEAASRELDSGTLRVLHARALAAVGRRDEALAEARAALATGSAGAGELLMVLESLAGAGGAPAEPRRAAQP